MLPDCTAFPSTSIRIFRILPASFPCGVREARYGVTSLADLGRPVTMAELDVALAREFETLFGRHAPSRLLRNDEAAYYRAAAVPSIE